MKALNLICIYLFSTLFVSTFACSSMGQKHQQTIIEKNERKTKEELKEYKILPIKPKTKYVLSEDWDLKGETYILPDSIILASKGGVFKNGTLIGDNSQIETATPLFNKVKIKGEWIVPNITTRLFTDLDYRNSLQDVLALANPTVSNSILIEEGNYFVSAEAFKPALSVCSNVKLFINGNIHLEANDYKGSYVLNIKDAHNVSVSGRGCIYGDKDSHKGEIGEWGHGINVISSKDVSIHDFTIRNCWGDCIYIGLSSKNIEIRNCVLDHGRRQGISVTSADGVLIENSIISNVSGTNPQAAIDIEPNHYETVDNVIIRNVNCVNCEGGIETWRPKDARLGSVTIDGCSISGSSKRWPIIVRFAEIASIVNCTVYADSRTAIAVAKSDNVKILKNQVYTTSSTPIKVSKCTRSSVKNNAIKTAIKK